MRIIKSLSFIVAFVFLVGCRTVNTTSVDQTITTDPMLSRYVSVLSIDENVLNDGLKKIQITVQNRTRFTRRFLCKVDWYDANGFLIQGPTNIYIPNQINGKETIVIQAISPQKNPASYKINFIKPK